jgi:hypothetical protein
MMACTLDGAAVAAWDATVKVAQAREVDNATESQRLDARMVDSMKPCPARDGAQITTLVPRECASFKVFAIGRRPQVDYFFRNALR